MSAIATLPVDPVTGAVGRSSGAPLYRRNSRFGPPERRKLDRNMVAKLMFCVEAFDRRTRAKGQHGGVLKGKGLDVLRALLKHFYGYVTGECFPSYDKIAEAAGCSRSTVAAKLRILEQLGIIETIRRKVVASFTSRVHRVRFNVAVQTSNSYVFNLPAAEYLQYGDFKFPLIKPKVAPAAGRQAESKFRAETSLDIKTREEAELAAAKAHWLRVLSALDQGG